MVGKDEVELVLVGDLISRIIAQTCRQTGLSVVYTELLDFGGDEIYFKEETDLSGKTYGEALMAYEDSAVIGIMSSDGQTRLNPSMDTLIRPGDQVIAVSEDDDTIRLANIPDKKVAASAIVPYQPVAARPEKVLILGWNWRAPSIVYELSCYVSDGSIFTIVANAGVEEMRDACSVDRLSSMQMAFVAGDTTDRRLLDSLEIETYDHIIVLGYSDTLGPQEADAATLVTLLHLRDMAEKGDYDFSIVSEMLDVRNRELAEVTRADDFIVSDKVISLMMTQISENKHLNAVFQDLFDPEGSEIYLKPASQYIKPGVPVNFYTVATAARERGETALGYKLHNLSREASKSYGVVVNPKKSDEISFSGQDRIIVLAED